MPATRFPKRPKPTQSPRTSLNASLHTKIDAFLKSARQCTQQVTPFESCLQDEMRVLERLYYKGVNQHRSALFWRKVKEVRRLGKRVLEVGLGGLLDDLRYSFYCVDGNERNPKILKGAWSQVPDAKFLLFIYERMRDILELINTTKERLSKAYHSLSQMMQTGAFLQLIVLLTAIVSRLKAITNELGTSIHSFLNNFEILLDALGYLHRNRKTISSVDPKKSKLSEKRRRLGSAGRIDSLHTDIGEEFGEDLGSAVRRKRSGSTPEASIHQDTEATASFRSQEEHILDVDRDPLPLPIPTPLLLPDTPNIIIIKTEVATVDSTSRPTKNHHVKTGELKTNMKDTAIAKVKKKKKKRKDEIDEIFGFL